MANQIYQVQVTLKDSKPKIWRRLLIPSDMLLADLHKVIQTSMGWTNSHLHQFIKDKKFYEVRQPDDDFWNDFKSIDYKKKKIRVSDLLPAEKETMIYEYDFGDGWEHVITLEKILPMEEGRKYPTCVAGKMACPPEDCGGVWGYAEMLKTIQQPEHEDYNDTIEWLGEDFEPEYFNIDEINDFLGEKNYGCISF
ncbi:MAG TPA: plasmid pRiA4b ORF-3 family protein [Williamwhitmania sp.]|nr:plasmid pRiA4b ORF-3 family protein [Williamwhitmania sp.]